MSGVSDKHGAYSNGLHRQDGLGQQSNDLFPIYDAFEPFPPAQRPMEIDATKTQQVSQPETPPISRQDELVAEVRKIYAGLVVVESECIMTEEAWNTWNDALKGFNVALKGFNVAYDKFKNLSSKGLGTFTDQPSETFSDSQQRRCNESHASKSRTIAQNTFLHIRTCRRLSDRLLPLLRREQDFEALQRWVDITKFSSSLIDLLDQNESLLEDAEKILLELLNQVDAVLKRLKLRFRCRYDELRRKYGLYQAVFEFPNNLRHICTTMPWTIAPALLVIWGVCWMFFASFSPEYERNAAAESTPSPSLAVLSFLDDSSSTDTSGK